MSSTASPPGLRISLRELLILFTTAIIGCVALCYANRPWVAGVSFVALLAFIAAAVIALIDRGQRQATAIGFIAAAGIYLGLLYAMSPDGQQTHNPELDPGAGRLSTTLALRPVFEAVRRERYTDPLETRTRRSQVPLPAFGAPMGSSGGYVTPVAIEPNRRDFMLIGHSLWTLLLGYAGGHFARWVYLRRDREQSA